MGDCNRKTPPPVGTLLGDFRRNAGLTQRELAAESGLSVAAIRDLEQGRRSSPRRRSIAAMAEALCLSPEQARQLQESARRKTVPGDQASGIRPGKPLWIEVLGPVAVWVRGEPVDVGSDAQRAVLGLLAIHHGLPVRREVISELLHGHKRACSAGDPVRSRVSKLRRMLRPAQDDGSKTTLCRIPGAYVLHASAAELDLAAFRDLVGGAVRAREEGDSRTACGLYEQAFRLCHGDPGANLSLLTGYPAMTELRLELADELLRFSEVADDLGRHDLVLRRLESLAAADPLNERAQARLMIALAACGQQARALLIYEGLRKRLKDELGVNPGEELCAAHLRVLRQEIGSVHVPHYPRNYPRTSLRRDDARALRPVPRQLPPAPRYFVGRHDQLALLDEIRREQSSVADAPVVAIVGMAGIGKTSLAAYWARSAAGHFPDGQLFANLRGCGPGGGPLSPAEVTGRFLVALGVPESEVPSASDARFGLYRELLGTRRMLVVLDNVHNAEQIRPLLSAPSGCFVLVTGRSRLTGLAVSHGARLLPLESLSENESRELLTRAIGTARMETDPDAVDEILLACSGLPLALGSVIAQSAGRPGEPLTKLAVGVKESRTRLDTLETLDTTTSVRAVFSWSRARLTSLATRIFHFLGLHPAWDVTVPEAASLAAVSLTEAYQALAELCDEHLLTEHMPGCYTAHELVRVYAKDAARTHEIADELRTAEHRLLDHYLHTVGGAREQLLPHRASLALPFPLPGVTPAQFRSVAEARDWLRFKRNTLLLAITQAATGGFTPHAWELPYAAAPFLCETQSARVLAEALGHALKTARRKGDVAGQQVAHKALVVLGC